METLNNTISNREKDIIHSQYPSLFPTKSQYSKYVSENKQQILKIKNVIQAPQEWTIGVSILSDNFGSKFGADYKESTTECRMETNKSNIPTSVMKLIQNSPFKDKHVPLCQSGIEPNPDFFFGGDDAYMLAVSLQAHVLVALCNMDIHSSSSSINNGNFCIKQYSLIQCENEMQRLLLDVIDNRSVDVDIIKEE